MLFSNLIGNSSAKQYLNQLLLKKRVPSTLLFSGPEGVGKGHFARELARQLLGEKAAQKQTPADLHIYTGDEESGMHSIESMRTLQQEAALPPFEAESSVFILENAERMLPTSANALLKILEEPPTKSIFILVSSDSEKLLPTIVSRSCKVPFFPVGQKELVPYLVKNCEMKQDEAIRTARRAQGSVARALELAKQPELCDELLSALFQRDYSAYVRAIKALEEREDLSAEKVLEEIALKVRDHELIAAGGDQNYLFGGSKDGLSGNLPLEKTLSVLAVCQLALERHTKLRTVLERLFL